MGILMCCSFFFNLKKGEITLQVFIFSSFHLQLLVLVSHWYRKNVDQIVVAMQKMINAVSGVSVDLLTMERRTLYDVIYPIHDFSDSVHVVRYMYQYTHFPES